MGGNSKPPLTDTGPSTESQGITLVPLEPVGGVPSQPTPSFGPPQPSRGQAQRPPATVAATAVREQQSAARRPAPPAAPAPAPMPVLDLDGLLRTMEPPQASGSLPSSRHSSQQQSQQSQQRKASHAPLGRPPAMSGGAQQLPSSTGASTPLPQSPMLGRTPPRPARSTGPFPSPSPRRLGRNGEEVAGCSGCGCDVPLEHLREDPTEPLELLCFGCWCRDLDLDWEGPVPPDTVLQSISRQLAENIEVRPAQGNAGQGCRDGAKSYGLVMACRRRRQGSGRGSSGEERRSRHRGRPLGPSRPRALST